MSPLLNHVEEIGIQGIHSKVRPYEIGPEDFFAHPDALKSAFAELVEIDDPQRVAIIPSASYGISSVAKNIQGKRGQEILLVDEQFPSNYYSWKAVADQYGLKLNVIAPNKLMNKTLDWNANLLEAIHADTLLVAMGHVHWADGTWFNLKGIRQKTNEVGAYLIIDGTQSVGALPFSVRSIRPDALICAGYKWLMGPYSIGVAYYGPKFDEGSPIEENWINRKHSERFSGLVQYESEYQPKAGRYSVGEHSNFVLTPMLAASIRQINEWGVENIQHYCKSISADFAIQVKNLGFQIEPEPYRCGHLFGIRLPANVDQNRLKETLKAEQIFVSFRGSAIRISPHLYNEKEDFDHFLECLEKLVK